MKYKEKDELINLIIQLKKACIKVGKNEEISERNGGYMSIQYEVDRDIMDEATLKVFHFINNIKED
jgi:hypothetical protein